MASFRKGRRARPPSQVIRGAALGLEALEERSLLSLAGAPILVNTTMGNREANPVSAMSSTGRSVVVWDNSVSSNSSDIRAGVYDAGGKPVTGEIIVVPANKGESVGGIAMDSNGNFVVTWTEEKVISTKSAPAISATVMAQRCSPAGAPVGDAITVATSPFVTAFDWQPPQVAMSSAGTFVIAYDDIAKSGDINVMARMYSETTGALTKAITVSAQPNQRETHPSIATDPQGDFAVAYRVGALGTGDIWLKRFASDGSQVQAVQVSPRPFPTWPGAYTAPSVAMNSLGNMVVAWSSSNGGSIQARTVSATGVLGNVVTVSSGSVDVNPKVAMDPTSGNFLVGYTEMTAAQGPNGIMVNSAARLAEVDAQGKVHVSFILAQGSPNLPAGLGSVSVSPSGRYLASYTTGNPADPSGGIFNQYGQLDLRDVPQK